MIDYKKFFSKKILKDVHGIGIIH